jgi:hypothetical protein
MGRTNRQREMLILTLFKLGTLTLPLVQRTFILACLSNEEPKNETHCIVPGCELGALSTYDEFSAVPGVSLLLAEGSVGGGYLKRKAEAEAGAEAEPVAVAEAEVKEVV